MARYQPSWQPSHHPARLWSKLDDGRVQCHLSPRNCKISEGQAGFCRVRMNVGGELVSLNYGRAIQVTQESIETEAVFHYAPGAAILSVGNIGCMMNCDYCHNWKTSQARFIEGKDVHAYTSEDIVRTALEREIPILSWTYNDPVVWHEFVLDTGRLARQHGLKNLFKSAFFISLEGAEELCEVVDIFSVSIKSMDDAWYRKISKGWLPPVLEATKLVFEQKKHVEISTLMVTDANDDEDSARRLADWVLTHLSADVPIHFVRFHPDYKYTHVGRTPVERLVRAREVAMEMGVRYAYVGNVYGSTAANTCCVRCGHLLVERYGLNTWRRGLTQDGHCAACAAPHAFRELGIAAEGRPAVDARHEGEVPGGMSERALDWRGDVQACHVQVTNPDPEAASVFYWRLDAAGSDGPYSARIGGGHSHRFIISKSTSDEVGVRVQFPPRLQVKLFEVFDRAHFPTVDTEAGRSQTDRVPLPLFIPISERAVSSLDRTPPGATLVSGD